MEKLVSNLFNIQSVPESYIQPLEKRPAEKHLAHVCKTIPVIDLGGVDGRDRTDTIRQILEASKEFGFFQVINHGIPEDTMHDMMGIVKEFFEMPMEDKANLYSEDRSQTVRLCTSIDYDKEETHFWRDSFRHPCHPVEDFMHLWPSKPTKYREVAAAYSVEARRLGLRLLELISEGLGIKAGYFQDELSQVQLMSMNHYPPCPNPSLTLGLPKHCDANVITLLLQGEVSGLQVFKDGDWFAVEHLPNSFVVNLGHQLQIISNGRLRSAEHRVVTNSTAARTTIGIFIYPSMDSIIEPAQELVNENDPPIYKAFKFQEFLRTYIAVTADTQKVLEPFKALTLDDDRKGV